MDDQLRHTLAAILGGSGLTYFLYYFGRRLRTRRNYDKDARTLIRDMDSDIIIIREHAISCSSTGRRLPIPQTKDHDWMVEVTKSRYFTPPDLMSSERVNSGLREAIEVRYRTLQELL